jgi:hypothetical protein
MLAAQTVRSAHGQELAISPFLTRRLLPAVLVVLAGAALSACGGSGGSAAGEADDTPVIATAPRTTSRASPLVVIGYANRKNRPIVERAVAILRDRKELATQRRAEIQRLHLKQLEEVGVIACDTSCPPSDDILGTATPDQGANRELVDCAVVLNMPLIHQAAREWNAPVSDMTALVLIHEQEHCLRVPDARETPAVAAELRLAQKLHNRQLVASVRAAYKKLDASGYWKE